MFREASNGGIDEYTETVTGFIQKCVEDVLTKTIQVYPNQKPWINNTVKATLRSRDCAYVSRDKDLEKKA